MVAMGRAVDVPGNVTPDAEFNAYVDPEALARLLDAGVRLDLVPLDATRQAVLERAALRAALAQAPRVQATHAVENGTSDTINRCATFIQIRRGAGYSANRMSEVVLP